MVIPLTSRMVLYLQTSVRAFFFFFFFFFLHTVTGVQEPLIWHVIALVASFRHRVNSFFGWGGLQPDFLSDCLFGRFGAFLSVPFIASVSPVFFSFFFCAI